MKFCVAIDLGASSGRVAMGYLDSGTLVIKEIHRFKIDVNNFQERGLRWEWSKIVEEVKLGLYKAQDLGEIISIGIDTWAVDYGLIDSEGALVEDPYCYRDGRTDGLIEVISNSIGAEWIYSRTGVQFIYFNTAYQFYSARDTTALKSASTFLMLPDLLNFVFCGVQSNDVTNASTTQLFSAHTGQWDWEVIEKFQLPKSIFPPLHKPGYKVGTITGHGSLDGISVVAVGSHDTASAVAGVPLAPSKDSAYISSGTWSLVGLELDSPITNETARLFNITNEVGVADRIRFLKNVSGMWLLEESVRHWKEQGIQTSAAALAHEAAGLPRKQIINTNDPRFTKPGAMPERISEYCIETNQSVPQTPAEFARCIFDSLAVAYAKTLAELIEASGRSVKEINIVGGGSSNELLNQLTADETGIKVIAGPVEATIMGNLIVQLMSAGMISSLEEGRAIIANSIKRKTFTPTSVKA